MKIERNPAVSPPMVVAAVAEHFRIPVDALLAEDRSQPLARWRQLAMHLIREICGSSFPEIARVLNRTDHSTVHHGCAAISRLLKGGDESLSAHANRIIETLRRPPDPQPEPAAEEELAEFESPYADARTLHILVVRLVSSELKVSALKIDSRSKEPDTFRARAVAMRLLRDIGWSFPEIGKAFGRDHSTVINALGQLEEQLSADRDFHVRLIRMSAQLKRIPRFLELSAAPP